MTANLNMRNVQETVEDTSKKAMDLGRKAYLTYLGVWGMGYDGVKNVYKEPMGWINKAEKRGKVVEKNIAKIFEAYQKDFPGEVTKLAESVQHTATDLAKSAGSKAEEWAKVGQKQFAQVVKWESAPGQVVEEIKVEAKAAAKSVNGSVKKVQEKGAAVVAEVQEVAESAVEKIWKGYDELGVKEIVAGLESMSVSKLEELRTYEVGGKNRVTVVREIDARMQAMTS